MGLAGAPAGRLISSQGAAGEEKLQQTDRSDTGNHTSGDDIRLIAGLTTEERVDLIMEAQMEGERHDKKKR